MSGTTLLTRRVSFAAAHRYRRPEWDDARNFATFGLCSRASYHGHTYVCDVTVSGSLDPQTGFVIDLQVLDRALATEVVERFDHRNINLDVPGFGDGEAIPTGENIARYICDRVQQVIGDSVRVVEVRVAESDSLSVTYRAP